MDDTSQRRESGRAQADGLFELSEDQEPAATPAAPGRTAPAGAARPAMGGAAAVSPSSASKRRRLSLVRPPRSCVDDRAQMA